MNWLKLKEKFPKSYNEIREFSLENNLEGRALFNEFLRSKGYKIGFTFTDEIKDYESKRLFK